MWFGSMQFLRPVTLHSWWITLISTLKFQSVISPTSNRQHFKLALNSNELKKNNQFPFSSVETRKRLLKAALKSPRRKQRQTGSDCEHSCC